MTRWFTNQDSFQEKSGSCPKVLPVEPQGLQELKFAPLFWSQVLAHAAHLAFHKTGLFSATHILKGMARWFLSWFFFQQELDKDFLPELTVAYDVLAFILPNRVVGGFVWGPPSVSVPVHALLCLHSPDLCLCPTGSVNGALSHFQKRPSWDDKLYVTVPIVRLSQGFSHLALVTFGAS